jgi:NDP-4-keto-2,6-dideoxyhexose 3-C-methyltransferase
VTIGSGIPIISEEAARELCPDAYFALPWHFIRSFVKREAGVPFIVPLPVLRTYGQERRAA